MKERFKEFLRENRLRQESVGKELGVSKQQISNYCTGRTKVSPFFANALKGAYNINPDWLLNGRKPKYVENKIIKEFGGYDEFGLLKLIDQNLEEMINAFYQLNESEKERVLTWLSSKYKYNVGSTFQQILKGLYKGLNGVANDKQSNVQF